MQLLTPANSNAKTAKLGEAYEAAILHFAPGTTADGVHTVCAWITEGCKWVCLNTAGRSQFRGPIVDGALPGIIHAARRRRTLLYLQDRPQFLAQLHGELSGLERRAAARSKRAVARLNGTSDVPWESVAPELFAAHPSIQFYDYTKSRRRALLYARGMLPPNYHLTYSRSERDGVASLRALQAAGAGVAVVFADAATADRRASEFGSVVVDGTASDWRFTDPRGALVALTAKGRAKHDASGFVVC